MDADTVDATAPPDRGIDEGARDRVVVEGPDARSYLHSQLAQDVESMPVGGSRWTLVLEPDGKVCALARVARVEEERYVLDVDAGFGDVLAERLGRFKIRVDAEVACQAAQRKAPAPERERVRIEAGWPRMGAEIVPGETIPAATGTVTLAVDFGKGCYPGQELVERMHSRGADAPRSLRVVEVAEGAAPGDPIVAADGDELGVLTSVAGGVGLGYVRRGANVGRPPAHTDATT